MLRFVILWNRAPLMYREVPYKEKKLLWSSNEGITTDIATFEQNTKAKGVLRDESCS